MSVAVDPRYQPIAPPGKFRVIGTDRVEEGEGWMEGDFSSLPRAKGQAQRRAAEAAFNVKLRVYDDQGQIPFETQ